MRIIKLIPFLLMFLLGINSISNAQKKSEPNTPFEQLINQSEKEKDFNKGLELAKEALKIAELDKDSNNTSIAHKLIAYSYYNVGDYKNAKINLNKALTFSPELNNNRCEVYLRLGLVEKGLGDLAKSMNYFVKADKGFKSLDNKVGQNSARNNVAILYYMQGNYEKAISLWRKNYEAIIKENLDTEPYSALMNMGVGLHKLEKYDQALKYYNIGLEMATEEKDSIQMAMCYENIGATYSLKGDTEKSKYYYGKSIEIIKNSGSNLMLAELYFNVAGNYIDFDIDSALYYAEKCLILAKKTDNVDVISDAYYAMFNVYEVMGKYEEAYNYHKLYSEGREKMLNEQSIDKVAEMEAIYENEKKSLEIDNLEKDQVLKEKEIKQRKITSYALAGGLVIVGLFLVLIFRNYKQKKKANLLLEEKNEVIENQKHEVEQKNKEITDSITYAKRIQSAILPSDKLVKEWLPNSFIFYKPKDIVAGDFYWMDVVGEHTLFAAADCTGHGVPGAMVSVVCHNAMNRVIRDYNLLDPGKILDKTREIVITQLNQSEDHENSVDNIRDGMDIALCVLNTKTNQLQYAGANNPLWILRSDASEIEEIKATKQAIGKVDNPKPYLTHNVELNKGDSIYLFSDGFADQFGGEKGKKLKYRPFKNMLISLKNESMENQLGILNKEFDKWKGDLEQVDDVCVIGVKI